MVSLEESAMSEADRVTHPLSRGLVNDVRLLRELAVPLRDGTVTRAEAWVPDGGPGPAILVRTPYLKETAAPSPVVDVRLAAERGYCVVVQDVRGRGGSEGEFEPFVNEERDGADSVGWLAEQAWCDGRVVMAGMSYVGATQWLAAAAAPPALRGIAPTLSSDDYAEGWCYSSGVSELGFLATWNAIELAPPDQRWHDEPLRARDDISVPALVIGGWYDVFCDASLRSFARSRHKHDRLVVGPWGHDAQLSHLIGEVNVGFAGSGEMTGLFDMILDFYDAVLAGDAPQLPRVSVYVLGARRWVGLDAWPPPGAARAQVRLEPDLVGVDPANPVPSLGGRGLLVEVPGGGYGIRDQRAIAARDDVVVALRHAPTQRTWVAGPARAVLRTDAEPGALWAVTLCVEQPDGALHNLTEGVATDVGEGNVEVPLGDVCATVEPGQLLVALVAGSSFPRWPRPKRLGTQRVLEGSRLELTTATQPIVSSR
jgi:uncharacterized protein